MNMRKRVALLSLILSVIFDISGYSQKDKCPIQYNQDIWTDLGVGLWAIPIPADYDGDGLKDLVVSAPDWPYRGLYYFRNIGTAAHPLFDKAVKLSDTGKNNIRYSDVEGGVVMAPGVMYRNYLDNLYNSPEEISYEGERIDAGMKNVRSNMWSFVDWDDDGDSDIVIGIGIWDDYGWDNAFDKRGRWKNGPLHGYVILLENHGGQYFNRGKILADNHPIDVFGAPNPCVADFDGDGDLDIICGEFLDGLTWFENTGTRESPVFAKGRRLRNRNGEIRFHLQMIVPVPSDFDGDGNIDLIVGDEDGRVAWIRNKGTSRHGMPLFTDPEYFRQKADLVKFGALVTPYSTDWDKDGLSDIVAGNSSGEIAFIRNCSKNGELMWEEPQMICVKGKPFRIMAGDNGSIQGPAEAKWGYTVLSVADLDNDGIDDILINSITGRIQWLKGLGGNEMRKPQPVYVDCPEETPKPEWNWWTPAKGTLVTQWRTSPAVIDWNNDGVSDIVMLDCEGYLSLYEGIPKSGKRLRFKPGRRVFYGTNCSLYSNSKRVLDATPGPLRLNNEVAGRSGRRKLCLVDWDNDGRTDLIVDSQNASWFRNVKTENGNTWFEYMGNISNILLEGHTTCPTPVDWDGDGRYDLLLGAEDGHLYFFKNNTE